MALAEEAYAPADGMPPEAYGRHAEAKRIVEIMKAAKATQSDRNELCFLSLEQPRGGKLMFKDVIVEEVRFGRVEARQ